jgi:hypothetical protein
LRSSKQRQVERLEAAYGGLMPSEVKNFRQLEEKNT